MFYLPAYAYSIRIKNHFNHFLTAFERARLLNLNITLHCGTFTWQLQEVGRLTASNSFLSFEGEVLCHDENDESTKICYEEVKSILTFGPDRLGHALLLPPSLQRLLSEKKIPVESCPTSNVMTLELAKSCSGSLLEGLKQHPQLQNWIKSKHPISIGTDDPGVFDTNPTKELLLLHHAFSISREGINRILLESMDHAFCDSTTKERMKLCIQERLG
jgi:adenosine deaminase